MRELVTSKVLGILNDMAEDDMDQVGFVLDVDLGYWNADDGPEMSKETYTKVVNDCSDEELLELYSYLIFGG